MISIMFIAVFMFCAWKVSQYEKALVSIMERLNALEKGQGNGSSLVIDNSMDSENNAGVQSVIMPEK